MNLAKCSEKDYIKFLVASFKMCTCTEAARRMPESGQEIAHDAITRLNPNRHVNPDGTSNRPISEVEIPPEGRIVHLKSIPINPIFLTE